MHCSTAAMRGRGLLQALALGKPAGCRGLDA